MPTTAISTCAERRRAWLGVSALVLLSCHPRAAETSGFAAPALAPETASRSGDFQRYDWLASGVLDGSAYNEQGRDVAFDADGNIVIVGGTTSKDFPTTPGAFDTTYGGGGGPDSTGSGGEMDAFVSKVSRDGKLIWSTYLGGRNYDRAYAVEIGPEGDVFVAGRAGDGFPTTPGVVQPRFGGDDDQNELYGKQDGFVARISADGSRLLWASYFGGAGKGFIRDLDVDQAGNVYVGLSGESRALGAAPEQQGPRSAPRGHDGYYGKLSADGKRLLFGTFYGGSDGQQDAFNPSVRVTDDGHVFVVAYTDATDVDCITPQAYQRTNAGGTDLLLMHFDPQNRLVSCTYVGGSHDDYMETHGLAVDAAHNAVIVGGTLSRDFPTTRGVVQPEAAHDDRNGFVVVIAPDGSRLLAGTYLGRELEGVQVAPGGDIVFSGSSEGLEPLTPSALRRERGARDALIGRVSSDLTRLQFLSYFGGSGKDELRSVDVRPNGEVAYVGQTESLDFAFKSAVKPTLGPDEPGRSQAPSYLILAPVLRP